ncbi:hypothetical protein A7K91_19515 [Paenibacillus oryzae]|uniref:Uncharacterized protein n=1 Tax=Paenibacillus oryzae TaxID=1844972 RepID=A0A1A5YP66_9BACL|nr:hypothetical protein A7K91_19515 [Paenibacillus oryzae]
MCRIFVPYKEVLSRLTGGKSSKTDAEGGEKAVQDDLKRVFRHDLDVLTLKNGHRRVLCRTGQCPFLLEASYL